MDAPWLGDPRGSREHVTRVSSRGLVDQQRRSIFILPEMRTQHQADGSTVKRQTISRRNSFLGHTIPFNKVAPVASLLSPTKLRKSKKSAKQRRKIPQDYDKHYRHSKITEGTAKFEDHANEWENYQLGGFIGVVNEVIATRKKEKALVTQWVIMPNSSFRKVWDIVLITCLCYVAVFLPMQLSFYANLMNIDNVQPWLGVYIVDRVTDCIFLVDIVINFRSPEVSRKGDVTTFNANQVASAYLHSWFSLDLVSIIPFDYISLSFVTSTTTPSGVHLSRLPRLLRMFRLTKILKVVNASRIFQRYESHISIKYGYLRLMKFSLAIVLMIHWLACAAFMATIFSKEQDDNVNTWLDQIYRNHLLGGTTATSSMDEYIASIYWATMTITTIGYGDITAMNTVERGFFIVMMLIGAGMYAYVVGTMCQLVEGLNVDSLDFQRQMDRVNDFLDMNDIPLSLRLRIRKYLLYKRDARISNISELLSSVSPTIRDEVALFKFEKILGSVAQFRGAPPDVLAALALKLTMMVFAPNEMITVFGRVGTSMYIINRGRVQIERMASDGRIVVVSVLEEGSYFGERGLLFSSKRRASVRALCFVEASCLTRKDLDDVTTDFPNVKKVIRKSMVKDVIARSLQTGEMVALAQDKVFVRKQMLLHNKVHSRRASTQDPTDSIRTARGLRGSDVSSSGGSSSEGGLNADDDEPEPPAAPLQPRPKSIPCTGSVAPVLTSASSPFVSAEAAATAPEVWMKEGAPLMCRPSSATKLASVPPEEEQTAPVCLAPPPSVGVRDEPPAPTISSVLTREQSNERSTQRALWRVRTKSSKKFAKPAKKLFRVEPGWADDGGNGRGLQRRSRSMTRLPTLKDVVGRHSRSLTDLDVVKSKSAPGQPQLEGHNGDTNDGDNDDDDDDVSTDEEDEVDPVIGILTGHQHMLDVMSNALSDLKRKSDTTQLTLQLLIAKLNKLEMLATTAQQQQHLSQQSALKDNPI